MNTTPVIGIDHDKCVNCHQCIAACPVKYCLDGSKETIYINSELCIGCGSCIDACSHNARYLIDDWDEFVSETAEKKDIVAIVAPSAAASYGNNLLNLNGWLASFGVKAFFDVSFGAELTVYSYLQFIKKNSPEMVIAQPCPVIVNYLELNQPSLLKYLAPIDSPMLHTVKMIRKYFPKYQKSKIIAISPCLAKKHEFDQTDQNILNITFASLEKYIAEKNIRLEAFKKIPYLSPSRKEQYCSLLPEG